MVAIAEFQYFMKRGNVHFNLPRKGWSVPLDLISQFWDPSRASPFLPATLTSTTINQLLTPSHRTVVALSLAASTISTTSATHRPATSPHPLANSLPSWLLRLSLPRQPGTTKIPYQHVMEAQNGMYQAWTRRRRFLSALCSAGTTSASNCAVARLIPSVQVTPDEWLHSDFPPTICDVHVNFNAAIGLQHLLPSSAAIRPTSSQRHLD